MTTFARHIERGARLAYVYHVAGMDWAATTDPDLAVYLNSAESGAATLRGKLFGEMPGTAAGDSCDMVQTVVALDPDLGAQTVTASRDGGIDVGSWNTKVHGDAGAYVFGKLLPYPAYIGFHIGLTGLQWSPDTNDPAIHYAVMMGDLRIDRDTSSPTFGEGTLRWDVGHDYAGLFSYVSFNGNGSAGGVFLWVGSSCLVTIAAPALDGSSISVSVRAGQFNTPLEDLFFDTRYRYQITSVPLEMAGSTARLFAVPFDVVETIS
jgi:hypothetical protein